MKFREHRGSLEDSMATMVEVADRAALIAHLKKIWEPFPIAVIKDDLVAVTLYAVDKRIGWNTYIVTMPEYGVLGFTDEQC